jgi:hypothetical protein
MANKTTQEKYNEAMDAYMSNQSYNNMTDVELKNHVESLGRLLNTIQSGFSKGTGIKYTGKNKATVKTMGTQQIEMRKS